MKRRTLVALTALVSACGSEPVEDRTDQPPDLPQGGWATAYAPASTPGVRGIVLDMGYASRFGSAPRPLIGATYQPWTSSRSLVAQGDSLYITDAENGALHVADRTSGSITRSIPLDGRPHHVVVAEDGTAWVSLRHGRSVVRIGPNSTTANGRVELGVEPTGMALTPDQSTLLVVLRGPGELVAVEPNSLTVLDRIGGLDRPMTVAIAPDGRATVAGRQETMTTFTLAGAYGGPSLQTVTNPSMRRNNPTDLAFHFGRLEQLRPNRATASTVSPENGETYVVHHLTDSGKEEDLMHPANFFPEDQLPPEEDVPNGGYGGGSNKSEAPHLQRPVNVTVTAVTRGSNTADAGALPVQDPSTLEPVDSLIAQPSDINHHPTHSLLFVTGFGSDNVLVLNSAAMDPMNSPLGIIRVGHAPSAVTFSPDGQLAYVLNAHDFTVSEIDVSAYLAMAPVTGGNAVATPSQVVAPVRREHDRALRFADDPLPQNARLGRRIFTYAFNDALSSDNRFACRSCHIDGAEDGLVWFIGDGPRQTPALAGRLADTAPFNWVGSEGELQNNMERTIGRMGGHGLTQTELNSLEQFMLVGLVPPPNPNRAPEGLTPSQERGRSLFFDPVVGCSSCHAGDALTDGRMHDVGTATEIEHNVAMTRASITNEEVQPIVFNTPSLRNLWSTAPYLHDGSAATLEDALNRTATTMGKTDHLTDAQRSDLVAYLLTL